jgi:6-hydroxytryprostatin B O-methyltransferase
MLPEPDSTNVEAYPLSLLGERIASNIAAITFCCRENDYPIRSAQNLQSESLLPPQAPEALRAKQVELLDLALELQFLATDPAQYIQRQAAQNHQFYCLRWLFHFQIPIFVPLEAPISYVELASKAGVPQRQLISIARMAILINFFYEPEPGKLAHNWNSIAFAQSTNLSELGRFLTDVSAPMATKMVEATEKWGETDDITHTAYNIVNETDFSIFKHLATVPELREQYATYMKNQAASEALSLRHLVVGFDWASLEDATVIDVSSRKHRYSVSSHYANVY